MKIARLASCLILGLALAAFALSCGSSGRHLQSITLTQTVINNGQQDQFVATGTFSAPPITVTPLPVDWTIQLMAPPPPEYTYTLTTQPYVIPCTELGPGVIPVVAFAPPDPNAPRSGTAKTVVSAATTAVCTPGGQSVQ